MLNISFWNLVFTIINLIVLYLLLKKFLIGPVTNIMQQRKEMIENQFAEADKTKEEALALKKQYMDGLEEAHDESMRIMAESRSNAMEEYSRIVGEAGKEASRIKKQAQVTVDLERDKVMQEMESEVAGLAIEAALHLMTGKKGKTLDDQMYDQFLAKAGEPDETDNN